MSKQIAVRLPEDLVDFVDETVRSGEAASRAVVVTRALERERRRAVAARDAAILQRGGDDPDMDAIAEYAARLPLDLDWMRPIHLVRLDKVRPALVLTRELVRPHMARVTVAPITSTVRGLSTELAVDKANGLDKPCVVNCDNIVTVPKADFGRQIGVLLPVQEVALGAAIRAAFDLD